MFQPLGTILKTKITQPNLSSAHILNKYKNDIPNYILKSNNYRDFVKLDCDSKDINIRFKQILLEKFNNIKNYGRSLDFNFNFDGYDPEHWVLFVMDNNDKFHIAIKDHIVKETPFIISNMISENKIVKYSERFFDPVTMNFGKTKEISREVYYGSR